MVNPGESLHKSAAIADFCAWQAAIQADVSQRFPGISVWAKQTRSPTWPSRVLCEDECKAIEKHKPQAKNSKYEYVGVYFYGSRQAGWVPATQITPLDDETFLSIVSDDKLARDLDYQRGVIEAARLLVASGSRIPNMSRRLDISEEELLTTTSEIACDVCKGTEDSGWMVFCMTEGCGRPVHAHCLDPPQYGGPSRRKRTWKCKPCQKKEEEDKKRKSVAESKAKFFSNQTLPNHVLLDGGAAGTDTNAAHSNANEEANSVQDFLTRTKGVRELLKQLDGKDGVESKTLEELAAVLQDAEKLVSSQSPPANTGKSKEKLRADEIDEIAEDVCFVCGLTNGPFLVCEFPSCPRVYHHACVCQAVPEALGQDMIHSGDDESWFCPAHFCTVCRKLEDPGVPLESTNPPSFVLQIANLELASLRKCDCCPFSVCDGCSEELAGSDAAPGSDGIFGSKPRHKRACQNCCSRAPKLRFHRLLERCWARMATSRLAVPFMRPCLPFVDDHKAENGAAASAPAFSFHPDLLTLLEKIRGCKYDDVSSFRSDLQAFRNGCEDALRQQGGFEQSVLRGIEGPAGIVMQAVTTILGSAEAFLDRHSQHLAHLEKRSKGQRMPASTEPRAPDEFRAESDLSDVEDDDEEDSAVNGKSSEAENSLRSLWRRECEYPILTQNRAYYVTARTLQGWANFVAQGPPLPATAQPEEGFIPKKTVRRLITDSFPVEDVINQEVAAGVMMSLRHATIGGGGDWRSTNSQLQLMLDDLDNATSNVFRIQSDIRRNILQLQRELVDTSAGSVTIGEAHVLRELQLANESLKVRLRRKDAAIALLKDTVRRLQNPETDESQRIAELQAERDRLKEENGRLQARLQAIDSLAARATGTAKFEDNPSSIADALEEAAANGSDVDLSQPHANKRKSVVSDEIGQDARRPKIEPIMYC